MEQATQTQEQAVDADVAIMGAGIVGLFNAQQYAKRGFRVLLLDNARGQKLLLQLGLLEPDSRVEPQETEAPSPVRQVAS